MDGNSVWLTTRLLANQRIVRAGEEGCCGPFRHRPPCGEVALDLTDAQWERVAPLIPNPPRRKDGRGRPRRERREVLDGVLWILRTGAQWAKLPGRYPPYQTCHRYFQRWCRDHRYIISVSCLRILCRYPPLTRADQIRGQFHHPPSSIFTLANDLSRGTRLSNAINWILHAGSAADVYIISRYSGRYTRCRCW